jgi:hypothetical protein
MKPIIISILILLLCSALPAVELELIDKVILSGGGGDDFIKLPAGFAVTEDGLYLVPDYKDGDLKVFNTQGMLVKRVGRKGPGPNEFISPARCDYLDRRFVVLDFGKRKYMLFTRDKESVVKETKVLPSVYMGNDVALMKGEKLLLAGWKPDKDGKGWECFSFDFKTEQYDHFLPTELKYGFKSVTAYKNARADIEPIGTSAYCDWWGDYAYFVWIGNLKVFKINMKTRRVETFGNKTTNYRQPAATAKLKKAYNTRNIEEWGKQINTFSLITGLITNKNYLLLMYEKPLSKGDNTQARMLQFYTLDGNFINEVLIPDGDKGAFYLNKDDDILYQLKMVRVEDEELEETARITRFRLLK